MEIGMVLDFRCWNQSQYGLCGFCERPINLLEGTHVQRPVALRSRCAPDAGPIQRREPGCELHRHSHNGELLEELLRDRSRRPCSVALRKITWVYRAVRCDHS